MVATRHGIKPIKTAPWGTIMLLAPVHLSNYLKLKVKKTIAIKIGLIMPILQQY